MDAVLQCLRKHGQRLDLEIARETGLSLAEVRLSLEALSKAGTVISCKFTRFEGDARIDALLCRIAGYVPRPAPGRKAT